MGPGFESLRAYTLGEVAEWSIAPVLKTDVLRGTGGSNPSLSALKVLQDIDYQSCRIFLCQKNAPKMHQTPLLRTSTGVFRIPDIPYYLSHFLTLISSTKKGNHLCSSLLEQVFHKHSPFLILYANSTNKCNGIVGLR